MAYEMKPLFEERMRALLPDVKDFAAFNEIVHTGPRNFIRCNTLKMEPNVLLKRLNGKGWHVVQPFHNYPEIMLVDQELGPGDLGSSIEHLLGYYYIQELSSMLSVLALDPQPDERVLDMCASPGSKTTQIAARMENSGTLVANDVKLDRIKILSANLERCGVSNVVATRADAIGLCTRLAKKGWKFDRILLDAPCSGEGTLRSSPKTFLMWNIRVVENLSRQQMKLIAHAASCLKKGGILVYSTCTHSPEENEAVVNFALERFPLEVVSVDLPVKCRAGVDSWKGTSYDESVTKSCRIYPQDNNTEGFFVCKMRLKEEVE